MNVDADADADAALFGDALGCDERLPIVFSADPIDTAAAAAQALGLLRALALIDEARDGEREDGDPQTAELARIEAKVDLLLSLFGAMLRERQPALPSSVVRWSRTGARFLTNAAPSRTSGHLRILPDARLPQVLEIPARVIATRAETQGVTLWLRFDALDPVLEAALERHVFSRHRRQIALARRAASTQASPAR